VTPPGRKGFGSRLIEGGLAQDLAGEVHLDYEPLGVVCQIIMPVRLQVGE
jgi:two-component sensor histidine kinase